MKNNILILKGIHPGYILERELKKRKEGKSRFAISLGEFPQTLVAITKGKRRMNTPLSLKIERALGWEEGYLMTLQIYHDIRQEKRRQHNTKPVLSRLRPALFWDTDMKNIDWEKQKRAVIHRVFDRGNEQEKNEIARFYGNETVKRILEEHA